MNQQYAPPDNGAYILYGADISLYSGKLRSYLKKKGIPFQEQAATYQCYKQFIVPRTGIMYIPVLQTADDQVWQDSTEIIDRLELIYPQRPAIPVTAKQQVAAHLIEMYADQWLLKTALHSRWHASKASLKEIWTGFGQLLFPRYPQFIQRIIGKKVSAKFRSFMPHLGIRPITYQAIELHTQKLTNVLNQHFSQHDFVFGGLPSVADYALIGVYYAHLYRDLDSGLSLRQIAPDVVRWVERMTSTEVPTGEYLADDVVPHTLDWIFNAIAQQQVPVMVETAEALNQWQQSHQASEVPRTLHDHEFKIEGVKSTRRIIAHAQYMMQRPLAAFQHNMPNQDLHDWASNHQLDTFLNYQIQSKIARKNNRFVFTSQQTQL